MLQLLTISCTNFQNANGSEISSGSSAVHTLEGYLIVMFTDVYHSGLYRNQLIILTASGRTVERGRRSRTDCSVRRGRGDWRGRGRGRGHRHSPYTVFYFNN